MSITGMILAAAFLGALLELDEYFIGMTLISQPVIAGGLAGFICGDPVTGIMIGGLVQLIWLMPPVGAYVPPSPSAIAFSTAFIGIIAGVSEPAAEKHALLMFTLIIGACFGYFTGQMDVWNRKLNTKIMRAFERKIEEGGSGYAYLVEALAVFAKYFRDVAGYLIIFIFGTPLAIKIYETLPDQVVSGLQIAFWAAPMIGFAVLFEMFRTKQGALFHGVVIILAYMLFSVYRMNMLAFMFALLAAGVLIAYNIVWAKKAK